MRFLSDPIGLLYFIPSFLIAITVHEVAHAYTAWKLGDPTASAMGRISLNPMRHIDPIGLIIMVVIGFGWAKPVQINPRNFKNEKLGMAISALAGPVSNIIMAFAGLIIYNIIVALSDNLILINGVLLGSGEVSAVTLSAVRFSLEFVRWNILFAVFNMIPIPPLDGSRIVNYFLPPRLSNYYSYVERYGFIVLVMLLWTGILSRPLIFMQDLLLNGMSRVISLFFNLFV